MKKLGFLATLLATSLAHAEQCPPSTALSHTKTGQHWQLAQEYQNQGWYVANYPYADISNLKKIPAAEATRVMFVSNEDDNFSQWFVTCSYSIDDSAFPRYVILTKNTLLAFNPIKNKVANFNPTNVDENPPASYTCTTLSDTPVQCKW